MPSTFQNPSMTIEARVTSRGQVTLPKEVRKRLGIVSGGRIRFNIPASGPVQVERISSDLEDSWRMADEDWKPSPVMSFEEMDASKTRRPW